MPSAVPGGGAVWTGVDRAGSLEGKPATWVLKKAETRRQAVCPCSGWLRPVFRGNIGQIRCPNKQRVCAIVGTQALGAQTCSYYLACLLNSYVISGNSANHDDLAVTLSFFFFNFMYMNMKRRSKLQI